MLLNQSAWLSKVSVWYRSEFCNLSGRSVSLNKDRQHKFGLFWCELTKNTPFHSYHLGSSHFTGILSIYPGKGQRKTENKRTQNGRFFVCVTQKCTYFLLQYRNFDVKQKLFTKTYPPFHLLEIKMLVISTKKCYCAVSTQLKMMIEQTMPCLRHSNNLDRKIFSFSSKKDLI